MTTNHTINSLRAIAIIEVVLIHVFSHYIHYATEEIFYIPFLTNIVNSGIPIFIFISGFILSYKYWDDFSIKTFYKKRFTNILFPYFFFCFLYVILPSLIEIKSIEFSFGDFMNILFDPWHFYYNFWYIGLIISFYIFYPLLIKIFVKFKNHLFYVLLISILIQIIWIKNRLYIIRNLAYLSDNLFLYKFLYWFFNYSFLSYISYFVLGVYICRNYNKIVPKINYFYISIIPIIIFSLINIVFSEETLELFFFTSIILFFMVLVGNERNIFLEVIARYSFGIYLIHGMVFHYVVESMNISPNYWYYYLFSFILTFSISFIIIYALSKVPKSSYLIGNIRPPS